MFDRVLNYGSIFVFVFPVMIKTFSFTHCEEKLYSNVQNNQTFQPRLPWHHSPTTIFFIHIGFPMVQRCFGTSHHLVFYELGSIKNFTKYTAKNLCRSLFLKNCRPTACIFIKRETAAQSFPLNFTKLLRASFL